MAAADQTVQGVGMHILGEGKLTGIVADPLHLRDKSSH